MSSSWSVLAASLKKEFKTVRRSRSKIVLIILLPMMFWVAFNVLMGGVYAIGIDAALVIEEDNPGFYTNALIDILSEPDDIPPSLNLIEMDAETATAMVDSGEISLMITIPDGFEESLENNESTSIQIYVNNAAEDMTKNLRMPVFRKLDAFYQQYLPDYTPVGYEYDLLRDYTFPRLAYMAWTISIYSVMMSAIYLAGSAVTQEFEQNTFQEIEMANRSPYSLYLGKILVATGLSFITTPILMVLSYLIFGVWPNGDILGYLIVSIPFALFCACLGIIFGAMMRNSVYLVPTAALLSIFYWMTGGGIAPLLLIGGGFEYVDSYLPISNAYRSLTSMFVDGTYTFLQIDLLVLSLFCVTFIVVSPIIADKISRVDFGRLVSRIRQKRRQFIDKRRGSS